MHALCAFGGPALLLSMTGQATRALSTARLSLLPGVHLPPIDAVVFCGPSESEHKAHPGRTHLG